MSQKKILVIDDDTAILEVIKIVLEDSGFTTLTLNTPVTALKTASDYQPNVILLDLWMPEIDGLEILKLLKKSETTSHIPVVLMSAINTLKDVAAPTTADDFLLKPFDIDDLTDKIKKLAH